MGNLSIAEQLMFCTTRISTVKTDNKSYNATGFFFNYEIEKDGEKVIVPVIITNKHVTNNAVELSFSLSKADENGDPLYTTPYTVTMSQSNLNKWIIYHPSPEVDLCAIFANPILKSFEDSGYKTFHRNATVDIIPNEEDLKKLDCVEDVLMVGYPNGMWDKLHNMPLVRRGITASPVYIDFENKPLFLIDAACYPGSSGSPVFIYNRGAMPDKYGHIILGSSKLYLIGIQYAVPTQPLVGEVKIIPTATIVAESHIMINLGYIIKSRCILDIAELIKQKLNAKGAN